MAKYTNGTSLG